jgi:archaellum biogenesis protein FlaJ (TadC family)
MNVLKKIPFKTAAQIVLVVLVAVIGFHLLIISGIVPYDVVWGGRLNSRQEMIQFESISIVLNLIMVIVVLIRIGYLKPIGKQRIWTVLCWVFCGLFLLNTLGNLTAQNPYEKWIGTVLTLLLSFLFARLALISPNQD